MATRAQMRTIALSMPRAEEKSHFGRPDFRVKNKIFAGLTEDVNRAYIKARPELQEVLLASPSGAFSAATGAWGRQGWTYIDLPKVNVVVLREIVTDAWTLVAPARLVAESRSPAAPSDRHPSARSKPLAHAKPTRKKARGVRSRSKSRRARS